ncbi:hypothetical protein ACP3TJ_10950 [Desulforudis sp. 1088]|uniref:hypothetical protein n=1 Tax=unclassified Candidatus Desulforudis TaxID=2635950 RepID=UPI003CE55550
MARKVHKFLAIPAAVLFILIAVTGLFMENSTTGGRQYRQGIQQRAGYENQVQADTVPVSSSTVRTWHRSVSELTAYVLLLMTGTGLWMYFYPRYRR